MAENVTARTDREHREALDQVVDHGHADSRSEAIRQTSQAELARMGYLNGTLMDTPLRKTVREFARLFIYGGFAWLGLTVMLSLSLRLGGVWMLAIGFVLLGLDQLLARVEPGVTDRLNGLVPWGQTA